MEWILQQEGSLGTILLMATLVVGLLYLLLPVFIWRIWYWSHLNSKHLKDLNTKLELLIRQIAPEALPPIEIPAPAPTTPEQEKTTEEPGRAEPGEDAGFLPGSDYEGNLSDDDSMEFSMADQFEDLSDDLADSEISDFTDKEEDEEFSGDFSDLDRDGSAGESDTDDELVMDFDDEGDDEPRGEEDLFSESDDQESDEQFEDEEEDDEFSFGATETDLPPEIPVTDSDASDFTVEHFESNEEKSFEFEDVDDDSFEEREESFADEDLTADAATDSGATEEKSWGESSTDDIWGEESAEEKDEEFSFGEESDLGAAFDEQAEEEKESVGDVANSFLSDLEKKLNLDDIASQPAAAPKPPPTPQPELPKPAPPAPKPEAAESQATLFARCEGCGHKLAYKQALSGKRVRCPACRTAFALP